MNKTNDPSLAVVVQFGAFKIVFTGDLEVAGWRRLLTMPEFRADLLGTTVFVASIMAGKADPARNCSI